MKTLLDNLTEELKDINKSPHNIHYTSPRGLSQILRTGFLTGPKYSDYSSLQPGRGEVATLRRSQDKKLSLHARGNDKRKFQNEVEMGDLSENIDGVKIYLFTDRIRTAVKTVKKYPIAEYAVNDNRSFKNHINNIYKELAKMKKLTMNEEELKQLFILRGAPIIDKLIKQRDTWVGKGAVADMFAILKNKFDLPDKEDVNIEWYTHKALLCMLSFKKDRREGEERITYDNKKSKGIPVKSEFMKIRFVGFEKRYLDYYNKIVPYMKKNRNLFIVDANFAKIIELVEKGGSDAS